MKVPSYKFEKIISDLPSNCWSVLLYGENYGLTQELCGALILHVCDKLNVPYRDIIRINGTELESSSKVLVNELQNIGMFAENKVIIVQQSTNKGFLNAQSLIRGNQDNVFLVMCASELDNRSSLRNCYENEDHLISVSCYKDDIRVIEEVIREFFRKNSINCTSSLVSTIASRVSGDRSELMNGLNQMLIFLDKQKTVTLQSVDEIFYNMEDTEDYQLIDAIGLKNMPLAFSLHDKLIQKGVAHVAIIKPLEGYFFKLRNSISQLKAGQKIGDIIKESKIFFKREDSWRQQCHLWKTEEIDRLQTLFLHTEVLLKQHSSNLLMCETIFNKMLLDIHRNVF